MSRLVNLGVRTRGALLFIALLIFPTTDSFAQSLPSGWTAKDIGSVGASGKSSGSGTSFTVEGAGADVWGYADAFRFTYRTLKGDGSIVAQVSSLERVDEWTKAGVMMRETLSANSRHAFMVVSGGKGLAFQRRKSTGGQSYNSFGSSSRAPYWVKVTRSGDSFKGYASADGHTWTQVGYTTIPMADTIYVGFAASSHEYGTLATASFVSATVASGTSTQDAQGSQTAPPPAPSAPAPSSSTSTLRVVQWNTHHGGIGTDGKYDPARLVASLAKMNPDIVSLNEVDDSGKASTIVSLMTSKTGKTWSYHYDARGNVVMTRFAIKSKTTCLVNSGDDRKATQISTIVNGHAVNVWSAHLSVDSSTERVNETKVLQTCEQTWAEARIAAGDFNMQAETTEYKSMTASHVDAWKAAKSLGTATTYSGNCDGCTRNSRIDYVFTSKGATILTLKSAQVLDTRDANGVMPSDHKPLLVTYAVK